MAAIRAFWSDAQKRRTLMWVVGVLGALVLLLGGYTFFEAHNQYTELSSIIERLGPPTDPNDPSITAFALMVRDRDKAEVRRGQGVMFLGLGLLGLGLAYLIAPSREAVSPPEETDMPSPPADAPSDG